MALTRRARSERLRPSAFWLLAGVAVPVLSLFVRFRVRDAHKLPRHGACIITANHYSEIDPVVMGVAIWRLGRLPHFFTKAGILRFPIVGRLLRASGQIPIHRAGPAGDAMRAAQQLLADGYALVVYPEGSLTRDPELWPMRGKAGAVRLALEHNVPIIPAAHWGTQKLMGRYSKKISFFPRKTIQVKIGDRVDLSSFEGRPLTQAVLGEATTVVMNAITGLVEDLRGEKAPPTRWDPAAHHQKETGRLDA